jgi:hypothetical protein
MLPFRLGMRVTGAEFCGRRRELAELREYLHSSGRVYVVGERRIGKTSLVFEALRTLRGTRVVDVDLLAVKTVADLTHRLAAAVIKAERKQNGLLTLLKGLVELRPTIGVDPLTNAPTVSFAPGSGDRPETLDAIFALLEPWRGAVVVFDEFQDILNLPGDDAVIARLRGLIQRQQHVSFVFCGSLRHKMEDIFTKDDSPFFKAAMRLFVGPLERPAFRAFLERKFESGGRKMAPGLLDTILDVCQDNPGDVQRFCTALWQVTSDRQTITDAELAAAWDMVFAMHAQEYDVILRNLSAQQSQTIHALARAGGRSNLSKLFLESTGITLLPSVAKAMSSLLEKGIVRKDATEYRLCDPFLTRWLARRTS